jgi:hypothetical protein
VVVAVALSDGLAQPAVVYACVGSHEQPHRSSAVDNDEQRIWDELDRNSLTYSQLDELSRHFQSRHQ